MFLVFSSCGWTNYVWCLAVVVGRIVFGVEQLWLDKLCLVFSSCGWTKCFWCLAVVVGRIVFGV